MVQLTCTRYTYQDRPGILLEAPRLRRVADLGVSLDFDIYDMTRRRHPACPSGLELREGLGGVR
jgi:hypothetical protein